jgi:hypothetical protein
MFENGFDLLARAIIQDACEDLEHLLSPVEKRRERAEDALAFIKSESLDEWAAVLKMDGDEIRRGIMGRLRGGYRALSIVRD